MLQRELLENLNHSVARAKNRLIYLGRYKSKHVVRDNELTNQLNHLKKFGYVMLENLLSSEAFDQLKRSYQLELEEKLNFETPCLAQNKIDVKKHQPLLDKHLCYTPQEFFKQGIAFSKEEVMSYQQVLNDHRPSTLKTLIPHNALFFNAWLHPVILNIVEAYMGLRPHLVEAYLRRNFPADHKVMNHFWHRDRNHKQHLLKAFIFFSDCEIHHGPHEYIAGSLNDETFKGKPYFTDHEIDAVYPPGHPNRITSIVKAGTIILEDTRGLHRAMVPKLGFRDLGYAVFFPMNVFYRRSKPHYTIDLETYHQLNTRQQSFILPEHILR
jgi:hypothetical protein